MWTMMPNYWSWHSNYWNVYGAYRRAHGKVTYNAIKFTPDEGTITVAACRQKNDLLVGISGTGIGIPPGELESIFDEFYQVKAGLQDKTPGIGLGLSLTRRIIELHSGKIWAESNPDQGSTFSFTIPITVAGTGIVCKDRKSK